MVGVAVKITGVPAQILLIDPEMETLTGKIWFTVMVTVLEVAGLPDLQVSLEVMAQVT